MVTSLLNEALSEDFDTLMEERSLPLSLAHRGQTRRFTLSVGSPARNSTSWVESVDVPNQNWLDVGFHPVELVELSSIGFNFQIGGERYHLSADVTEAQRQEAGEIIVIQSLADILGRDFRDLLVNRSITIPISHQGETKDFVLNPLDLPLEIFEEHYRIHEQQLSEEYGIVLQNCRSISRSLDSGEIIYREIYRCISNREGSR